MLWFHPVFLLFILSTTSDDLPRRRQPGPGSGVDLDDMSSRFHRDIRHFRNNRKRQPRGRSMPPRGVTGSIDPLNGIATAPIRLPADFLMNRVFGCRWVWALLLLAPGCQVCQITDCWNDGVDHFAECELQFDDWYDPHCDLTREYRPDGGDHWLFRRCACEQQTCR